MPLRTSPAWVVAPLRFAPTQDGRDLGSAALRLGHSSERPVVNSWWTCRQTSSDPGGSDGRAAEGDDDVTDKRSSYRRRAQLWPCSASFSSPRHPKRLTPNPASTGRRGTRRRLWYGRSDCLHWLIGKGRRRHSPAGVQVAYRAIDSVPSRIGLD